MPYKSQAQQRKFHQLLKEGKISKKTVDEFDKASKGKELPDRVKHKGPITSLAQLKKVAKAKVK